jgi:diacylglycerol kinase (ATP)
VSAVQAEVARPLARPLQRPLAGRDLVLVANGTASGLGGSRQAVDDARSALAASGARVETHLTETVAELAASWADYQDRRVVLLGGDGTVHAAANLAFGTPELALLPAGRANNIARALGIPIDLSAAARLAADGEVHPIDLISARNGTQSTVAVEGVSVGLHAVARAGYRGRNSADVGAALRVGFSALRAFDGVPLCVSSDGASELLEVGQLFVANLSLYAFGLEVAPGASATDGLVDVVALPWEGRARVLPTLVQLRRGTHVGHRGVRRWTARRVWIATRGASPVIADTVNLGTGPVTLETIPGALPLVRP